MKKLLFVLSIIMLIFLAPNTLFGQQSNCLNFDGSDDYINLGMLSPTGNFSTGFTYEGWINWTSYGAAARLIDFGAGDYDHITIRSQHETGGVIDMIRVEVYNNSTVSAKDFTTSCVFGTWYHIAVTIGSGNVKLYINGELISSQSTNTLRDINRTDCFLGKSYWSDPFFHGYMDEVRIWDVVRTQTEIQDYMHNPLNGNEAGLVAYYDFNQGIAEGDNDGLTTLLDKTTNYDGILVGFDPLSGSTSNWVAGHKNSMQLIYDTNLEAGTTITLPLFGNVDVSVDWGDVQTNYFTTEGLKEHTYTTDGIYTVTISGNLEQFGNGFTDINNINKLNKVVSFGELGLTSLYGAFRKATNLYQVPEILPQTINSLEYTFYSIPNFNQDISCWDVSNITSMTNIFTGTSLPTEIYTNMLISWSQLTLQPNVTLDATCNYFTFAQSARDILTSSPNNWTINDNGAVTTLNLNLVAYYPFNDNANDESENSNNGDTTGHSPTLVPDRFGNENSAYNFDGIDDYIIVPNDASLDITNQISLCSWIRPTGIWAGSWQANTIVGKGGLENGYAIGYQDNDGIWDIVGPNACYGFWTKNQDNMNNTLMTTNYIKMNKWQFFVATYDGSTKKIYVDGVLVASTPYIETLKSNTDALYIGKNAESSSEYLVDGEIDDIRIYNRTLNQFEISQLYNRYNAYSLTDSSFLTATVNFNLPITVSDTLVSMKKIEFDVFYDNTKVTYNDQFTINNNIIIPGGVVLNVTDEGNRLSVTATAQTGYSFNGVGELFNIQFKQITPITDTAIFRLSNITEYYETDTIICGESECNIVFNDFSDGLIAYYPFNDNLNDMSENTNNGTYGDGSTPTTFPTAVNDRFGNPLSAYSFDGGDWITIPDQQYLNNLEELTMVTWIKPSISTTHTILYKGETTSVQQGLYFNSANKAECAAYNNFGDYAFYSESPVLELNNWYQIVGVIKNNEYAKIYVNGILVDIANEGQYSWFLNGTADIKIGCTIMEGTKSNFFNGIIDDISIYNRELSEDEIWALYNSAYAGENQYICEDATTLSAKNPAPYSGQWYTTSTGTGIIANSTNNITSVTDLAPGENIFEWVIDISGNIFKDSVSIFNNAVTAYAGEDTTIYWTMYPFPSSETPLNANPVDSPNVGIWSTNSPDAIFDNSTNALTWVRNLQPGLSTFTWTVSNENCVLADDMLVFAANYIQSNASGNWNNPDSWTPKVVPGMYDSVIISGDSISVHGYDAEFDFLRIGTSGTLTVGQDATKGISGIAHGGHIVVEQEIEKSNSSRGLATLNIQTGGHVVVEQEIESPHPTGSGVYVGSGGHIVVEQEIEKNPSQGNDKGIISDTTAQLTCPYLFVGTTIAGTAVSDATVFVGNRGHIVVEQEIEKSTPTIVIHGGGHIIVEQEIEKSYSAITVRNNGHIVVEQEIEKDLAKGIVAQLSIRGGHIVVEQEIEKDSRVKGYANLFVGHGGHVIVEQEIEKATPVNSFLEVPTIKIQGGTITVGSNTLAKAGSAIIKSGHIVIEQEIEKITRIDGLPNLVLGFGGTLNFYEVSEIIDPAYISISDNSTFTIYEGGNINLDTTNKPLLFIQDGGSVIDLSNTGTTNGQTLLSKNLFLNEINLFSSPIDTLPDNIFDFGSFYSWNEQAWNEETSGNNLNLVQAYKFVSTIDSVALYSGTLNSSELSITLLNTNSIEPSQRGWNLIGNPFSAALDIETIDLTNIENTFYIYNNTTENFETYQQGGICLNSASQYVAPTTGFFLKSSLNANNPIFTVSPINTIHEISGLHKATEPKVITDGILLSVNGNSYSDQTLISLNNISTDGFDTNIDAFKLFSLNETVPQLYTLDDDNNVLTINSFQSPIVGETKVVKLNFFSQIDGNYTINVDEFDLSGNITVNLHDKITDETINLRETNSYNFTYTSGQQNDRFELIFGTITNIDELDYTNSINIYSYKSSVFINLKEDVNAHVDIYNKLGIKILSQEISGTGLHELTVNNIFNNVIVTVTTNTEVYNKTVMITE